MPEKIHPVRTVLIDYDCDECDEPLTHTGEVYTSFPPSYPHVCPNGHRQTLGRAYPRIDYLRVAVPPDPIDP